MGRRHLEIAAATNARRATGWITVLAAPFAWVVRGYRRCRTISLIASLNDDLLRDIGMERHEIRQTERHFVNGRPIR